MLAFQANWTGGGARIEPRIAAALGMFAGRDASFHQTDALGLAWLPGHRLAGPAAWQPARRGDGGWVLFSGMLDNAAALVAELGLPAYLLTGDHDQAALTVARDVGIPVGRVIADVRPEDKHAMIADLQKRGKVVAMVGDGVNDAAALAQADLGIAMGTGTDVAADSADIVLLRSELPAVVDAIELSRATLRTIKQNLGWAFGYNIAAIPLAMAGLLNPMIAGGAMAASSVLVVSNSLRLRRWSREG